MQWLAGPWGVLLIGALSFLLAGIYADHAGKKTKRG